MARMPGPIPLAAALDVGGTKVAAALLTGEGQLLARADPLPTPDCGGREFAELLAARARQLAGQAETPIAAAGVSVAGRVEPGTGVVEFAPHLPGLAGFPLGPALSDELGVPTSVVYDGHAGALGEYRFGAGRGARNMAFLIVGTGVGGGLVLDGRLYQGSRGIAGAAGWMIVDPWAAATPLARQIGALESAAAGPAIAAAAGRPAPEVAAAAAAGDARCRAAVEDASRAFAHAVVGIVSLLDLDAVVLGGGVGSGLGVFTARAREAVGQLAQPASRGAVRIVPAALGGDAFLLGAASQALPGLPRPHHVRPAGTSGACGRTRHGADIPPNHGKTGAGMEHGNIPRVFGGTE
jgi:glucokinase